MVKRGYRCVLACFAFLASIAAPAFGQAYFEAVPRVVALADVHGAYTPLLELLEATDLVDADGRWIGADAHLVSLGDLLDRGPRSREVMDLLMRLQSEALAAGGRVHVVLGNHELMNLAGDLRYVSAEEYASFAGDESPEVRERALEAYAVTQGVDEAAARAAFTARYPAGFFAHRAAFGEDGLYGTWLRSLPAVVVVNDTAFVHGGLPKLVAELGAEEINARLQSDLERLPALRETLVADGVLPPVDLGGDIATARAALEEQASASGSDALAATLDDFLQAAGDSPEMLDGPLWYRGSVYCKPVLEEPTLAAALERLGAGRVVVGHTPTDTRRVTSRYDGRLLMLDTGMLAGYYAGRPSALILEGVDVSVQYLSPPERGAPEPGGYADAYGLHETELLTALSEGTVTGLAAETRSGGRPVTLDYRGQTIAAAFFSLEDDESARLELAAYRLSELLGFDLIAPTVERSIDGEPGVLELRYADSITEAERLANQLALGGWCELGPQVSLMHAFDLLIANTNRLPENILFRRESSNLVLTDHRAGFGTARSLPSGFNEETLSLTPSARERLASLDEASLEAALGNLLGNRQLRALLSRRDELL